MRFVSFLCFLVFSSWVRADLYRWVDRETGSVKYSNFPPPWYGDPLREGANPAVEILRHQAPAKPPAEKGVEKGVEKPPATAQLEERWRSMLQFLSSLPQRPDFDRSGQVLQQQVQALQAARAELDRLDPNGMARRRAEETTVLEQLRRSIEAQ